eukprot:364533-Chlamydomonas_euryale.AAC.7
MHGVGTGYIQLMDTQRRPRLQPADARRHCQPVSAPTPAQRLPLCLGHRPSVQVGINQPVWRLGLHMSYARVSSAGGSGCGGVGQVSTCS